MAADGLAFFCHALARCLTRRRSQLAGDVTRLKADARALRSFLEVNVAAELGDDYDELLLELLERCSVWFPIHVYADLPVLLPYVKRDNGCRKELCATHTKRRKGNVGEPRDAWSMPTRDGYVRDDNSLIKLLVGTLPVRSKRPELDGKRLGRNFVACHIWPVSGLADPWLNSFVPNLVWLPKPLDVLSDRSGHLVQDALQWQSNERYHAVTTRSPEVTASLWSSLRQGRPFRSMSVENEFVVSRSWLEKRKAKIDSFYVVLSYVSRGQPVSAATGHSHYDQHLKDLEQRDVLTLAERVSTYRRGF